MIRSFLASTSHQSQLGFTLVEMMITIVILGILSALAYPAFTETQLSVKVRSYANSLVGSAHLARAEAIKRNVQVSLCVSADGSSCGTGGWEQGWIVLAGTTVIQRQQAATAGIKVIESSGQTNLIFQPSVIGTTQATLTICRATPSVGDQERVVTISATGKPSVAKTTNGVCS